MYSDYRPEVAGLFTKQAAPKPENYEYRVISLAIQQCGLISLEGLAISRGQAVRRLGKPPSTLGWSISPAARTDNAAFRAALRHESFGTRH